jgi:hypothetical protein
MVSQTRTDPKGKKWEHQRRGRNLEHMKMKHVGREWLKAGRQKEEKTPAMEALTAWSPGTTMATKPLLGLPGQTPGRILC